MLNIEDVVSTVLSTLVNSASLDYITWSSVNPGRMKMPNAPIYLGFVEAAMPVEVVDNKIGFSTAVAGVKITLRKYSSKITFGGEHTIYDMERDVKGVLFHNTHSGEYTPMNEKEFDYQSYHFSGDLSEFTMIYRVAKEMQN